jgi:hypothetical protein
VWLCGGTFDSCPGQWWALCESVGFRLCCEHHATLVKRGQAQKLIDGGEQVPVKEHKSFFRRLAEQKSSPRINHEVVLCFEKPEAPASQTERTLSWES